MVAVPLLLCPQDGVGTYLDFGRAVVLWGSAGLEGNEEYLTHCLTLKPIVNVAFGGGFPVGK